MIRGLTRTYTAGAAVVRRRIVKFSADRTVVQGAASTDLLIGVSDQSADTPSGGRVDVHRDGMPEVEAGGPIGRGQPLTSDAVGRAIVAAPASGVNVRIIGFAEVDAVLGDIIDVMLEPGYLQG